MKNSPGAINQQLYLLLWQYLFTTIRQGGNGLIKLKFYEKPNPNFAKYAYKSIDFIFLLNYQNICVHLTLGGAKVNNKLYLPTTMYNRILSRLCRLTNF